MSDLILGGLREIIETFLQWTGCGIGRMILKLTGVQNPSQKQACTVGGLFWVTVLIVAVYYLSR